MLAAKRGSMSQVCTADIQSSACLRWVNHVVSCRQVDFRFTLETGQEQTSHTDNVGRLRETTLRWSPLRYASDWRQDIDTAPAALRMTSSTTSGFDNMGTCEDATSVVVALHALRDKTLQIGGNRLVL